MATVDTTTKLSYLLPTGTFLTFQVLAPLATNNGKCGTTEVVLTIVALALLTVGCVLTSFTDSYVAPDGKVYNGFLTYNGLLVPGYEAAEMHGDGKIPSRNDQSTESKDDLNKDQKSREKVIRISQKYIQGPTFKPLLTDYINATLSVGSFLTLTLFTDPVATCFYPNISETLLKTLPVLLAAVLSFFCTFSAKIRHGFGNSFPTDRPSATYSPLKQTIQQPAKDNSRIAVRVDDDGTKHSS